jgi:hypothetical protein
MIDYKADTGEVEAENARDESGHAYEVPRGRTYNGYHETAFDSFQLDEIDAGERAGVDVSLYAKPENGVSVMHEIRTALQKGLDVRRYLDRGFDSRQLGVIVAAIERGLTSEQISKFADTRHNFAQMTEVAKGIRQGVDVSAYNRPFDMDAGVMRAIRHGFLEGNDLSRHWSPGVSGIALEQILRCHKDGTDWKLVEHKIEQGTSDSELMALTDGLAKLKQDGVDCNQYVRAQVAELALGAHEGIDYERYLDPMIDPSEMREMRNALLYEDACKDTLEETGVDLRDELGVPKPVEADDTVSVEVSEAYDETEHKPVDEEIPY